MPESRRHLLFPTPEESNQSADEVFSDHLSMLAEVPLGEGAKLLHIISLNTLGPCAASGLHDHSPWEDDEKTKARYKKIANGLKQAVNIHGVDAIALQETHPGFIIDFLEEALGEQWEVIPDPRVGMVTCYTFHGLNC